MPRKSKVTPPPAPAPTPSVYSRRTDPPRPFYVVCRACRDEMGITIFGHSSKYQGTFIVKDREVVVLEYSPENRSINCHWETKTRTKLTKADGKYCPVSCAKCGADVGRIYSYLPFYPDIEGVGKVALFKDRIHFDYDIVSSGTQTPTSPNTEDLSEVSQSQEESVQDSQYQGSEEHVETHPEEQSVSEEIADDILALKRFCLTLDEHQETLSKKFHSSQNSTRNIQRELEDLKGSFKKFETRLSAVESSVQNRLTALESALQIILENQTQSNAPGADAQDGNVDITSRRSNVVVEIPVKRRHRSPSPRPAADQQSQNISPPLSEEPSDESNKDTTSKSKHAETRTTRRAKSQPRQADSTNPSNAQEAREGGVDEENSRQARDEEGTRAETSIVISDDESDDDDGAESAAEHASKRAKLNSKSKKEKKQQRQSSIPAKKKRGRPTIGSSTKQELRTDKPDENEDYDDRGTTGRTTRSKRSS
ncbi:hypothetical protein TWF569_010284 [Orbilia oligospora]|uniref:Yippee domain-containing protein n=1 Tax=Orbilia oligospora TaxID=2813651 RepID=A0A7C8NP37_ORBOL|nr:hypothetical protein TWF706_009323 [Orbilia oligospora]KAF3128826.1 hypothetical protein TWF703_009201 [Orbilia oligospora]KAF3134086.1 hypothetical protein TWF569_010284 [Orbilia oligospora]KAF3145005.1 hypothetical protein TWF594_004583 [Orbilia oligospora]